MKLTFLGTGTSTGVPTIGCRCETCLSDDPRDKRLRVSVLIEHNGKTVLIDTSADFRQQALKHDITRLDALLITHSHVDHIFGLDDVRPINFRHGALGVYADAATWDDLRRVFQYIFKPIHIGGGLPKLIPHTVEPNAAFCFGSDLTVTPLLVMHGKTPITAFRLNDFAYATDVSELPDDALKGLRELDVLVLDCLRFKPHSTHLHVEKALEYVRELRPKQTYFTHINHDVLHTRDSESLPDNVYFAYDGLIVER